MRLKIFYNELDATEFSDQPYECLLSEWMRIREQYPAARLYKGSICQANDATPKTKAQALKLLDADDDYQVLCHAGDPITIAIASLVLSVGMAIYSYLNMPKIDPATQATGSNNNSLANRQNKHRTGQRVPDIYGRVKSIPDLIAPVYRYYAGNIQVEECLLSAGGGYFDVSDICEAETPIETISGASLSIYQPGDWLTNPAPQIRIGEVFSELPIVTKQVSSVDGKQKLIPPNSNQINLKGISFTGSKIKVSGEQQGDEELAYDPVTQSWHTVETTYNADFTGSFSDGEQIIITGASITGFNFDGTYTIATVVNNEMTLVNPASVNAAWNSINDLTTAQIDQIANLDINFQGSQDNFAGWYYAGSSDSAGMLLNFLAANGIYEGDKAKQVGIEVQYQQVINKQPVGDVYKIGQTMRGKANSRDKVGMTIKQALPFTGQFRFRAKRQNNNGNDASLIDDVLFESAYSYYTTTKPSYEYDTIVRLKRLAIGSGTNASELNMLVTRKLYSYQNGVPSASRLATTSFADSMIALAIDPFVGRMAISDLDTASIYDTASHVASYFGTSLATEFNYTFDDAKASYQEMAFALAQAVFCNARRESGLHYVNFERETPNSIILFNHRNMKPESTTVTDLYGVEDDYDGLEFKWRDATDNYSEAVIKLPDAFRTNYKTVDSVGVTNNVQAHFLAHRAWNKLRFNRQAIEFTGYGEADLVTRNDRIAVVDSTVPLLSSGQIEAQDANILTLDYPVKLEAGKQYMIHLQLKTAAVDVIPIVNQLDEYRVTIARIPLIPLVISGVACATFAITLVADVESNAYLIHEKNPSTTFESTITAIQYDNRYYQNDTDYINGLVS